MEEKTGEDKISAIYLMVRQDELRPEDGGSFEPLLEQQKQACLTLLEQRVPAEQRGPVAIYTRRGQLLMDLERQRIQRVVAESLDRLGSSAEEIAALEFELNASGVALLTVRQ